jgi:signal transduction histidine kinase
VRKLLSRVKDELSDAVLAVRRVVDGLRPPSLDELGLIGAIRQQVALLDTSLTGGLDVRVVAPNDLGPLPAATEVAAFRIVTEAVTNTARHAEATTCTIEVRGADALQVEIRDDGRGISNGGQAGVGLISMKARAEELGGLMRVKSSPGAGTCITATLPLT